MLYFKSFLMFNYADNKTSLKNKENQLFQLLFTTLQTIQ